MMKTVRDLLIRCLSLELGKQKPEEEVLHYLRDAETLSRLYELAKFHDVEHLIGDLLDREGLAPIKDGQCSKFLKQRYYAAYRDEQRNTILAKVKEVFEAEQIPYLPLKGAVLASLYPESWMRMGRDIDILVREEDYERAISLLCTRAGATAGKRSFHDITLHFGVKMPLELHFCLLEEKEQIAGSEEILSDVFDSLSCVAPGSAEKKMSDEMFYYYHIVHMAKHILTGGYGIRAFIDLYVLDNLAEHDEGARNRLLRRGRILHFANVARNLTASWFTGAEATEEARELEQFLFLSGAFGTNYTENLMAEYRKGGQKRYLLHKIFLPYEELKEGYPVLVGRRFLTPLFEVIRWFRLLFGGGAKRSVKQMKQESELLAEGKDLSIEKLIHDIGLSGDDPAKGNSPARAMLQLLRCEVSGESPEKGILSGWQDEFLLELYKISMRQEVAHLVGDALNRFRLLPENQKISEMFLKRQFLAAYYNEQHRYLFDQIREVFQREKIPYLSLKGLVLRQYYPEPWMRTAGDLDILVRAEDLDRACRELKALGGKSPLDGGHDIKFEFPNQIILELHYRLLESERANNAHALLDRVWEFCRPIKEGSFCYRMDDAFFYYYHIAHTAKHFEVGTCGVRPFLDLWIINHRANPDREKIAELLQTDHLSVFAAAAENLSEYWFSGEEPDELSEQLETFLLSGGVFGDYVTQAAMQTYNHHNTFRYLLNKIFKPYKELVTQEAGLRRHPILLPYYEVKRWIRILFSKQAFPAVQAVKQSRMLEQSGISAAELRKKLNLSIHEE